MLVHARRVEPRSGNETRLVLADVGRDAAAELADVARERRDERERVPLEIAVVPLRPGTAEDDVHGFDGRALVRDALDGLDGNARGITRPLRRLAHEALAQEPETALGMHGRAVLEPYVARILERAALHTPKRSGLTAKGAPAALMAT